MSDIICSNCGSFEFIEVCHFHKVETRLYERLSFFRCADCGRNLTMEKHITSYISDVQLSQDYLFNE